MKLWGGRFEKQTDDLVKEFNSSISFDKRMYRQDIAGSIAHAKMLGKQGIIPQEESDLICRTLADILADFESGRIDFDMSCEDIHSNIEKLLIERIGETGKMLHTGRSRNDQVALDFRMYIKEEIDSIASLLRKFMKSILDAAEKHTGTIMPGYTHMQRAQPVTYAHHLMAYLQMLKRDAGRLDDCKKRTDAMPLGAGALAATVYPLDRDFVARELGFSSVTENSLDSVSDRDFACELLACLSIVMMHLSRFAEECVLWSTSEFAFIEMDDAFSTGSSIMPQKKNPDVTELIRGRTGRVYGNLVGMLTTMKGLPLSYNSDMQEDKEAVFEAIDTVKACLRIFEAVLRTMKVNTARMRDAAAGGYINATDVADYLTSKGMPFRSAHEVTGRIVLLCISRNIAIDQLTLDEFKSFSSSFEQDIFDAIKLEKSVGARSIKGGPAGDAVRAAISEARKYL